MFPFSGPVPRMFPDVKRRYWEALLCGRTPDDSELVREQVDAEAKVKGADTPEELQEMINVEKGDPLREQAIRAAAAKQITRRPASEKLQHRLQRFAPLLEPNPRSMKRLANAYGMQLATHFPDGSRVSPELLGQWTIL